MGVTVDGRGIGSAADLSERVVTVLAMIPTALDWLSWATRAADQFDFTSEVELVTSVQVGQHATEQMTLGRIGLVASPLRLLQMSDHEVDVLYQYEHGDEEGSLPKARVKRVLRDHDLVRFGKKDPIEQFMTDTGHDRLPFLRTMSLQDRLCLRRAITDIGRSGSTNAKVQQDGADFAAASATGSDFADSYTTFLELRERSGDQSRREVMQVAQRARRNASHAVFASLRCPEFMAPPTERRLYEELNDWLDTGCRLGYRSVAAGVKEIVLNGPGLFQDAETTFEIAALISMRAHDLVARHPPSSITIGQDGTTFTYHVSNGAEALDLVLSDSGTLTMSDLRVDLDLAVAAAIEHQHNQESDT